jgi:predicted PurR-regulated permease PerM
MQQNPIKTFWNNLNNSKLIRYLLLLALGWAIAKVLAYFSTVIIIFSFAIILAFLLNYPVQWLKSFLPHNLAVIFVFILTLVLFSCLTIPLGLAILSQAQQLLNQSPEWLEYIANLLDQLQRLLSRWNIQVNLNAIENQVQEQALAGLGSGLATLQGFFYNLVNLILIGVVAFFLLLDGQPLWNFAMHLLPQHLRSPIAESIKRNFLGFFWGRLILSIFFCISCLVVFLILKVPYGLVLAVIAGIFDLIPGIGATLGIGLITIILLPQGVWLGLQVLFICIILQQIEENLLMPRIMKDSISLNPVIMFFALLVGARIAGLLGIFLAIPVAGILISLGKMDTLNQDESS